MDYNDLPETFVIFICTFDLLKKGLPIYTFKYLCKENKTIELGDGTTKVVVNSQAFDKATNKDLAAFLQYINGETTDNNLVKMIEMEVTKVKQSEELREAYVRYSPTLMDARREGQQEGLLAGRQEGLLAGQKKGAYQKAMETAKALTLMNLSIEQISKATGLSVKEIEKL